MRETADIVAAYRLFAAAGRPSALATVVGVEGSAYRRPGARMLVAEDGRTWGGVSGGCLERDVATRARGVIDSGRPLLCRYDTSDEESIDRGVTTGCGGTIEVLIQPLATDGDVSITVLAGVLADGRPRVLATVVRSSGGWKSLEGMTADATNFIEGEPMIWTRVHCLKVDMPQDAERAMKSLWIALADTPSNVALHSTVLRCVTAGNRMAEVFFARVTPPQRLVLVGGGPDVVPVVTIAKTLGWRVAVVAARPATTLHERFAHADERYVTGPDAPLDGVPLSAGDAVVVMTHNLARDAAVLAALTARPRYLGVLGPQHRAQRLVAALPADHPGRSLHSPTGLDLGAEAPEEIALSIVAEVQASLRGRSGVSLSRLAENHDNASSQAKGVDVAAVANHGFRLKESSCPV